uniref:histidine kinase n=1 Tax=Nitratidesulfovibrio vulgaris (strain DSM 19637 / Miyazaki F) TaxID=883 RepID=B8DLD1_NITV9
MPERFIVTALTVVFIGVLVISGVTYRYTRGAAEEMAGAQMVQALELLDRDVSGRVRDIARRTVLVSQEEVLQLALEDSYLGRSARVSAQRRLDAFVQVGGFSHLLLADRAGMVVLATLPLDGDRMNISGRDTFRSAMRGVSALELVEKSRLTGGAVLVTAEPVRGSDGEVAGIVAAITAMDVFARDILDSVHLGATGGAYILSGTGRLLARPAWAGPEDFSPDARLLEMLREADGAVQGATLTPQAVRRAGRQHLITFRRNAATDWFLVVEADEGDILAPARRLAAASGGISLVTLACVALALGALQRAMARLRRSEDRFSSLFRLSPDSVLLVAPESGVVEDVNDAAAVAFGLSRQAVAGRRVGDLGIFPDDSARQGVWARLKDEGTIRNVEVAGRAPGGEDGAGGADGSGGREVFHSLSGQAMDIGGSPLFMLVLRDVTELKKMQAVMIQTEKMISVGGIAAGIAHEINNPLGAIMQASQNMQQRMNTVLPANIAAAQEVGLDLDALQRYLQIRKVDRFIEDIRAAGIRASAIIRHMLDFSRGSAARSTACDLRGLMDRAVNLAASDYDLKKNYDFRKIRIDIHLADGLPPVPCVETEVEQVLLNLLRNAAQALAGMDPPRDNPHIVLRAFSLAGWLRLEVEDNGPGMTPEVQRRIFEPFYTTKPPGVGTGLGLSVSYFIITKGHEGRMDVESRPGEGSVFRVDLPLGGLSTGPGPSGRSGGGDIPPDGALS